MATILTIQFQAVTPVIGPTTGYTSGGQTTSPPVYYNTIDSFPFSAPFATATDVGDLSQLRSGGAGQSSTTDGYTSGGYNFPPLTYLNVIDRFPFNTPFATATDVGDLSQSRGFAAGQSSDTDGYSSGGNFSPPLAYYNTIDSFPFSSPFTTATDAGDLFQPRRAGSGHSSDTDGYTSGGLFTPPLTFRDTIDSFPFSSPFTTATDIGNLTQAKQWIAGQSSDTDGYVSGGNFVPPTLNFNTVERFPFSSPFTTATDIGDLSQTRSGGAGQNSDTDGYTSGGYNNAPTTTFFVTVDSFPFSSPFTTATDVGDLFQARRFVAGQQG